MPRLAPLLENICPYQVMNNIFMIKQAVSNQTSDHPQESNTKVKSCCKAVDLDNPCCYLTSGIDRASLSTEGRTV